MTSRRRILFISHSATRTGAPIVLLHLMRWLRAHTDFDLETLVVGDGPLVPEFESLGPVSVLGRSSTPQTRRTRLARRLGLSVEPGHVLERLAARRDFSLVYSNTITNGRLLDALAPLGCPVITHVHELEYWIWRSGPENLRAVRRHTNQYIAASEAVQRNLVERHGLSPSTIQVVYECVPASPAVARDGREVRVALGVPPGAALVAGCGAEAWRKGLDLFVQLAALGGLDRDGRAIHYVWIGSAGTAEEKYQITHDLRQSGAEGRFHFTGEVENPLDFFAAADVFALCSREDPFPLVCLEAASLGKPIVCFSGAGGIPELVSRGTGMAVPYLNVGEMSRSIVELLADRGRCREMGERGRAEVQSAFSVESRSREVLAIILQWLDRSGVNAGSAHRP